MTEKNRKFIESSKVHHGDVIQSNDRINKSYIKQIYVYINYKNENLSVSQTIYIPIHTHCQGHVLVWLTIWKSKHSWSYILEYMRLYTFSDVHTYNLSTEKIFHFTIIHICIHRRDVQLIKSNDLKYIFLVNNFFPCHLRYLNKMFLTVCVPIITYNLMAVCSLLSIYCFVIAYVLIIKYILSCVERNYMYVWRDEK